MATLAVSAIRALFTKAKRCRILSAVAGYCAVLVIFPGNPREQQLAAKRVDYEEPSTTTSDLEYSAAKAPRRSLTFHVHEIKDVQLSPLHFGVASQRQVAALG